MLSSLCTQNASKSVINALCPEQLIPVQRYLLFRNLCLFRITTAQTLLSFKISKNITEFYRYILVVPLMGHFCTATY